MSEKVNIAVTSYDKNKFQQTVNTQFTQFGITTTQPTIQTLSVNDFLDNTKLI